MVDKGRVSARFVLRRTGRVSSSSSSPAPPAFPDACDGRRRPQSRGTGKDLDSSEVFRRRHLTTRRKLRRDMVVLCECDSMDLVVVR